MSLVSQLIAVIQAIGADIKALGQSITTGLAAKVDKVTGKALSTNDLTDALLASLNVSHSFIKDTFSGSYIDGGVLTPTGGINFSVSAGSGYARDNLGAIVEVNWGTLTGACLTNGDNFIGVDYNGDLVISTTYIGPDHIGLAYINTYNGNTAIAGLSNLRFKALNHIYNMNDYIRKVIGSMVHDGCNISLQANPNQLKVTLGSGVMWSQYNPLTISDTSTFTKLFGSLQGFVPDTTNLNTINTAYWNDRSQNYGSALVALTAGYYTKHLFFINPEGLLFFLYGTAQYATLDDAKLAPEPQAPISISASICRVATVIVQQGATDVSVLNDTRPIFQRLFQTGVVSSPLTVVSHHDLVDNQDGDDHTQYHNDTRGDIRYYRKSEIVAFLLGKAEATHTHVVSDITGLTATLATLATLNSPNLTGVPTAPTAAYGTNTTALATTQFVQTAMAQAIADLIGSAPGTLDQLAEIATAIGNDPNFATTLANQLALRLRIDAAQTLTAPQQAFGRANLGLAASATVDTSTTANITDATNKRFVTDVLLAVLQLTSGTNSGDETTATIKLKLGAATALADGYMTLAAMGKLDGIAAGANNYAHPNHSGDVASTGDGATVIQPGVVGNSKLTNIASGIIKGRTAAGTGAVEDLTTIDLLSMLLAGQWYKDEDFPQGGVGLQGFSAAQAGAGSGVTGLAIAGVAGVIQMSTGTTATGWSAVNDTPAVSHLIAGAGELVTIAKFQIPVLSVAAQRFSVRIGFGDSTTSADNVDSGGYIEYTDTVNGGNWVYCTASNSTRTKNNSAVAAVAQTGDNWTYLKAMVNAAGTQADIYLNNTLLGSITTNIPTGTARGFGMHFDIVKTIGTTARTLNIDRVYQHMVRSDSASQNWRL